jgi:hypothetical protein
VISAFLITDTAQPTPKLSGYHLNEPGFMSDQTDIYPIGYEPQG